MVDKIEEVAAKCNLIVMCTSSRCVCVCVRLFFYFILFDFLNFFFCEGGFITNGHSLLLCKYFFLFLVFCSVYKPANFLVYRLSVHTHTHNQKKHHPNYPIWTIAQWNPFFYFNGGFFCCLLLIFLKKFPAWTSQGIIPSLVPPSRGCFSKRKLFRTCMFTYN